MRKRPSRIKPEKHLESEGARDSGTVHHQLESQVKKNAMGPGSLGTAPASYQTQHFFNDTLAGSFQIGGGGSWLKWW